VTVIRARTTWAGQHRPAEGPLLDPHHGQGGAEVHAGLLDEADGQSEAEKSVRDDARELGRSGQRLVGVQRVVVAGQRRERRDVAGGAPT
jgi:hypothetical protein